MILDRVFVFSASLEFKSLLSELCKQNAIQYEEASSIDLNIESLWFIDKAYWDDFEFQNIDIKRPWNFILLSNSSSDLKNNIFTLENLLFLKIILKYPYFLKYKKILIVDDDINQLQFLKNLLSNFGFKPYCISNPYAIKNALKHKQNLIILDLYIHDTKMDSVCKNLKSDFNYHDIPVIFISASEKRQDILDVLESGANDYIKKPFLSEELLARIGVQLRLLFIFDENNKGLNNQEMLSKKLMDLLEESNAQKEQIENMNKMLKKKSVTDPLTQIYNRGYLFGVMEREIEVVKRYKKELSAIMFDLDHFKKINDTYGHLVGDQILKGFVEVVKKRLRTSDLLTRYGGEEFVVILTDTGPHNGYKVAEDIRILLKNSTFKTKENKRIKISVSGGVTSYQNGEEMDIFFSRLDQALYKAKANGRNQIVLF